mmetsp:Transcript_12551/g.30464  ORF Transcript_12551/g.30464 Transcript_12551/m.30464 type:complete len:218 (-) Transcript_12551:517-1170(-)
MPEDDGGVRQRRRRVLPCRRGVQQHGTHRARVRGGGGEELMLRVAALGANKGCGERGGGSGKPCGRQRLQQHQPVERAQAVVPFPWKMGRAPSARPAGRHHGKRGGTRRRRCSRGLAWGRDTRRARCGHRRRSHGFCKDVFGGADGGVDEPGAPGRSLGGVRQGRRQPLERCCGVRSLEPRGAARQLGSRPQRQRGRCERTAAAVAAATPAPRLTCS